MSLPTGGQACPLTVPVTDSIAHSLTTENKVHFHNEEEGGKGKGRHHRGSGLGQGRQVESQNKVDQLRPRRGRCHRESPEYLLLAQGLRFKLGSR